jgi:hypothetical protein
MRRVGQALIRRSEFDIDTIEAMPPTPGRLCGGCGRPVERPPRWLCSSCSVNWEVAIELQTNPSRAADIIERARIDAYRERLD